MQERGYIDDEDENETEKQYSEDEIIPKKSQEADNVNTETKNGNKNNETRNDTKRKRNLEKTVRGNDEKNVTHQENSLSILDFNCYEK